MVKFPTTADFYRIVTENIPLIDVRAPVEFKAGAFPMAVNLPILDDEDRHLVGVCYKQKGKEAAFELAYRRVSGHVRETRIDEWCRFYKENPNVLLYCFRGGMRSKTAQEWLLEQTGTTILRLEGGYKAFRRYLIETLNPENISAIPLILGGRTGTGKTLILHQLNNSIDLEGIANHRGSAFGSFISPQPSQIDFENRLAVNLIRHHHQRFKYIVLEDEGSYIGARYIPHDLAHFFKRDRMVLLECELDKRLEITFKEYVVGAQQEYVDVYGAEQGIGEWLIFMHDRLQRIRKRLGGERLQRVQQLLEQAYRHQLEHGDLSLHKHWIEVLLTEYYDPMYDYQIEKSGRKIVFRGGDADVLEYLQDLEISSSRIA